MHEHTYEVIVSARRDGWQYERRVCASCGHEQEVLRDLYRVTKGWTTSRAEWGHRLMLELKAETA
jgi:hypothetical protein